MRKKKKTNDMVAAAAAAAAAVADLIIPTNLLELKMKDWFNSKVISKLQFNLTSNILTITYILAFGESRTISFAPTIRKKLYMYNHTGFLGADTSSYMYLTLGEQSVKLLCKTQKDRAILQQNIKKKMGKLVTSDGKNLNNNTVGVQFGGDSTKTFKKYKQKGGNSSRFDIWFALKSDYSVDTYNPYINLEYSIRINENTYFKYNDLRVCNQPTDPSVYELDKQNNVYTMTALEKTDYDKAKAADVPVAAPAPAKGGSSSKVHTGGRGGKYVMVNGRKRYI